MAGHENRTHRVTTQEIHNRSSFLGGATEQDFHFHISFGKVNGVSSASSMGSIGQQVIQVLAQGSMPDAFVL